MFEFIKRENDIFEILQRFLENKLDFILIGGYAVSAFKHRFSVDADVVIKSEDQEKFEILLEKNGFNKTISKELENIYSTKFLRFEKRNGLPINIDLLIDGIGIRQTGSSFSFEKINSNSIIKEIKGIEKEIKARIPIKEILIAMKLLAGRLTDFRDIVALSKNINVAKIKEFLEKEDKKILKKNISNLLNLLDKREFIDSFKGVFIEKKFDLDLEEIKKLESL